MRLPSVCLKVGQMKRVQAGATAAGERLSSRGKFFLQSISPKKIRFRLTVSTSMAILRKHNDGKEKQAAGRKMLFLCRSENFRETAATTLSSPSSATP